MRGLFVFYDEVGVDVVVVVVAVAVGVVVAGAALDVGTEVAVTGAAAGAGGGVAFRHLNRSINRCFPAPAPVAAAVAETEAEAGKILRMARDFAYNTLSIDPKKNARTVELNAITLNGILRSGPGSTTTALDVYRRYGVPPPLPPLPPLPPPLLLVLRISAADNTSTTAAGN